MKSPCLPERSYTRGPCRYGYTPRRRRCTTLFIVLNNLSQPCQKDEVTANGFLSTYFPPSPVRKDKYRFLGWWSCSPIARSSNAETRLRVRSAKSVITAHVARFIINALSKYNRKRLDSALLAFLCWNTLLANLQMLDPCWGFLSLKSGGIY